MGLFNIHYQLASYSNSEGELHLVLMTWHFVMVPVYFAQAKIVSINVIVSTRTTYCDLMKETSGKHRTVILCRIYSKIIETDRSL